MKKGKIIIILLIIIGIAAVIAVGVIGYFKMPIEVANAEQLHEYTKSGHVDMAVSPSGTTYTYHGSKNNINITDDFTIMTDDEFFTCILEDNMPGRILENMTLDGNGHTITIKGEVNNSLGRYNKGLFAKLINCTIKNLNIVYDVDLNIKGSSGSYFGGLCGEAIESTIENVNVTYNRNTKISFMTESTGYHNSIFGGLAGKSSKSTFNNCKVNGFLYGTGGYFGGLLGYTNSDVVISNSVFEGSIKAIYLEECFVGGLVGFGDGELYSSKVLADKFEFTGEPQGMRSRTSSVGGLVGKLGGYGNLHDCYLEFKENGYFYAETVDKTLFHTTLYAGVLVGEASKGSKIKNIYADGYNDTINNIKFADSPVVTSTGVRKNESTDVYNVYFVDDSYYYNHEESFIASKETIDNAYSFKGTIHGSDATVKLALKMDFDTDQYIPDYILLTIGEESYELKNKGLVPNDQWEYSCKAGDFKYIINISENPDHTYTVKFNKYHNNLNAENDVITSNYIDIVFDNDDDVIGGSESFWDYDQTAKRPLLKSFNN